jgi:2-polyprenyl-3-methyl-5-hydroxy-6-metoxy-1,4-benzoquinol methylase
MDSPARALLAQEIRRFPQRPRPVALARLPQGSSWDLVVVDARRTSRGELEALLRHGPVACLDEGGEAAAVAPFLIDTIPGLPGMRSANLSSPAYLDLPRRVRGKPVQTIRKVLVSFGGEDNEDLSGKLLDSVQRTNVLPLGAFTVVEGPLFAARRWPPGVRVIRDAATLTRSITAHDLVITHFGITAFEALACGVPVILLNPTRYHAQLGSAAGFATFGTGAPRPGRLAALIRDPGRLYTQVESFNAALGPARGRQLARLLGSLRQRGSTGCPVCSAGGNRVIARFSDRSYRRCSRCGMISLESFARHQKAYGKAYFDAEYKAQYGRSYLEDFQTIKAACMPRVRIISQLLGKDAHGHVVDVGCAYGPFLAALGAAGMPAFGLDVSPGAVAWVRRKLGLPAIRASFEEVDRRSLPRSIAAITLWYVLEHFTGTDMVLRKAAALLPAGGVLAFSTPNGRGISASRNFNEFLRNSPADHFTIFSPHGLGNLLARYGLVLRRVRVTGHHPERFPGVFGAAARRWRLASAGLLAVSRLFGLGDTFEAYAVKGDQ